MVEKAFIIFMVSAFLFLIWAKNKAGGKLSSAKIASIELK